MYLHLMYFLERREILYSDAQKYVTMLMDYVNDIENLLMKAQE